MDDIKELEEQLKREKTQKSLIGVIKDTLSLGIEEFSNAVGGLFNIPSSGDNQITQDMEKWERGLIDSKKKS